MTKLKAFLERLLARLGANRVRLAATFRRWSRHNAVATRSRVRSDQYRLQADEARTAGEPDKARKLDKLAARADRRALRHRAKAQEATAGIKRLKRKIGHLEVTAAEAEAEIQEWKKKNKLDVSIAANKITGGTDKARFILANLLAAQRCASGKRANFYSQPGGYVHDRLFVGEVNGQRSDCSQFTSSVCWTAGLKNPNGDIPWSAGGYTGTQRDTRHGWEVVSEAVMRKRGWGRIVYGGGTGHHTENYIGDGRTIGHGSAPIDEGVVDLFGDGDFTCLVYGG